MTYLTKIDMDNGSFPLAKDSLRALTKTKISGAHRAIIDVIWLETYAWHDDSSDHTEKIKKRRTHARIPYQVFVEETWMDKTFISRKLNELVAWNIIIRDKNTSPYTYSFNVHVQQWDKTVFRDTSVYRMVNSLQDSQQFTEQSTKSLQDSQLGVDRTVNCLPLEMPNNTYTEAPLKKVLKKDKESIITTTANRIPYKDIIDLYHTTCISLPKVRTISNNRKIHIKARYEQYKHDLLVFAELFRKAEDSDFLTGREKSSNPKFQNFKANFDWLINEHNMAKVLEGKYVNRPRGDPFVPSKQTTEQKLLALEGYL